jgi:hypothetical protein
MTPVTSISAVSNNSEPTPASLAVLIGQTITARVLSVINDTTARLLLPGGGTLDIETGGAPLAVGTTTTLNVEGTPAQPRFVPVTSESNTSSQPASSPSPNATLSAATLLVRDLAARQNGLPALYADLEAFSAASNAAVPHAVTTAVANLLAFRLDLETGTAPDADAVQTALLQAGLESASAGVSQPSEMPTTAATLVALRQSLQSWLGSDADAIEQASTNGSGAAQQSASSHDNAPPPPYRGAPTVAQAPVAASIAGNASLRERALHLIDQTDAVVARRALLQIASLPPDRTASDPARQQQPVTVLLEIPLTTGEGTASAQIRISRDARRQDDPAAAPAWHVDFSTTFEPLGPVHTHIAVAGRRTTVTLNAERGESAALLSSNLALLDAGLRNADLEPGAIRCQGATPRVANASQGASPGTFLDQAT